RSPDWWTGCWPASGRAARREWRCEAPTRLRMTEALRVEDVRKSFDGNLVLDGVSLALAEHEVVCLIGASGSGKSTLLRCIDLLSGGQQQRVAIVRALAMKPDLLLLDEITSALDPELIGEVLNVVRDLATQGMTMLIATHEMGFARDIASRVAFLDEGRIAEEGPPERIFTRPENPRTRRFLDRIIAAGRL